MPGIASDGSEDLPWDDKPAASKQRLPTLAELLGKETNVPDHAEELYRKTFETISHYLNAYRIGRVTEEQFATAIDALFMAVSGLVPELPGRPDFMQVISACKDEATAIYPVVKRVFFGKSTGNFKVFTWQAGDDFIRARMTSKGELLEERKVQCPDAATARDKLNEMADPYKLKQLGYLEL